MTNGHSVWVELDGTANSEDKAVDVLTCGAWADAVDVAVRCSAEAIGVPQEPDWAARAGDLDWDCRTTVLHMASDCIGYAGQVVAPRAHGYAPFDLVLDGSPDSAGLGDVVRTTGGILSAVVRSADLAIVSWHPYGVAGPMDFAAMGIVELLVHTEDLSRGLDFPWAPPDWLCARTLEHLFPDAPRHLEPWPTLLWATGRIALGHRPRQPQWRWANTAT